MAYSIAKYPIPAMSFTKTTDSNGMFWGDWQNITAIPKPGVTFHVLIDVKVSSATRNKHTENNTCYGYLALGHNNVQQNSVLLYQQFYSNFYSGDTTLFITGAVIPAAAFVSQVRIGIELTGGIEPPGQIVTLGTAAGNLIYFVTASGLVDVLVDAQKVQCGAPMLSWPGSTNDPTRLRYNIKQTVDGNIDWDGSIPGSSDIRKFQ